MGGGGVRPSVAATNSEFPEESPICDFACHLPENPYTVYLKVVGITTSQKRTITKKIDLYNYGKNDVKDKDKWGVDYDGEVSPFFCHCR